MLTCRFDISMRFFKKYPKFFKFSYLATVSCGAAWLCYQIKTTKHILSNALDTSVLSIAEPTAVGNPTDEEFFIINVTEKRFGETLWSGTLKSLNFALAKRLVVLANTQNRYIKKKAIKELANIHNLDSWQYSILASMIDARTAVALARTLNTEPRFFTFPHLSYFKHTHDMIMDIMKNFLVELHEKSQHPCMGYFISKAFKNIEEFDKYADEYAPFELKNYIQTSEELLPLCLESILHHASIRDYAKQIADLNGLPLLMEIHHRFKDNIPVNAAICRIISYISIHNELLEELHKAGWIAVLSQWVKHEDVRISIPAAKALANLDSDESPVYLQRLYPLHPPTRVAKDPSVDVVFVHGLLGGVFFTWRQRNRHLDPIGFPESLTNNTETSLNEECKELKKLKSVNPEFTELLEDLEQQERQCSCHEYDVIWEDIPVNTNEIALGPYCCPGHKYEQSCKLGSGNDATNCWPKDWLAKDCEDLRIIGVNYETNLSLWTPICPVEKVKTLTERSEELIEQLSEVEIGKRPIVWVTHSMGGLMVKCLLNKAAESNDKKIRDMYLNTKGVVFYSTPHVGSSVASFSQASALVIWPSIEVQELQKDAPHLVEIHKKFLEVIKKHPDDIKIVTFIETKPTVVSAMKLKFLVVEPDSGNPGCGEYYEIPLDHLGICKPASRHSFLYQKVLHIIKDISNKQRVQFFKSVHY